MVWVFFPLKLMLKCNPQSHLLKVFGGRALGGIRITRDYEDGAFMIALVAS
jgi:hypothetical protein